MHRYLKGGKIICINIDNNLDIMNLTLTHRETHGCVVSTVATDALVLEHQVISILSGD